MAPNFLSLGLFSPLSLRLYLLYPLWILLHTAFLQRGSKDRQITGFARGWRMDTGGYFCSLACILLVGTGCWGIEQPQGRCITFRGYAKFRLLFECDSTEAKRRVRLCGVILSYLSPIEIQDLYCLH